MYELKRASAPVGRAHANLSSLVILIPIVACLGPSKLLPFLLPFALLIPLVATRASNVERIIGLLAVFVIQFLIGVASNPDFKQINAVISLVTFAALWLLLLDFRGLRERLNMDALSSILFKILLLESVIGIVQGVYGFLSTGSFAGDSGDRVAGTIKLSLYSDGSFSNAIFTIIVTSLLILLGPYILKSRKRIILSSLPLLAIILSSVIHVIIFSAAAVLISSLAILRSKIIFNSKFLIVISLLLTTVYFTVGQNLLLTQVYLERAQDTTLSPRSTMINRALEEVVPPGTLESYIGNGSGQFTSRAGLIGSGYYFGGLTSPLPIPYVDTGLTRLQSKYLFDLWYWAATTPWYGSTDMPYFSWLTIYTENGILGVIIYMAAIAALIASALRNRGVVEKVSLVSFILFLALLGFSENYFELPQAILPGILLFKLLSVGDLKPRLLAKRPGLHL